MTIFIAGPGGKPMAFENDADLEAYRQSLRRGEPPLLQCLRKHRSEVLRLYEQMKQGLTERGRHRTLAFESVRRELRDLNHAMVEDIKAAERETAKQAAEDRR